MVRLRVRLAIPRVFQPLNVPGILLAAALVSAGGACSDKKSPTSPTQSGPRATALKISGCSEAEGYQCRAFVTYSDGKEEEVSASTQWKPLATPDERLTASFDTSTGRLTPKFAGKVTVAGQYQGATGPLMTGRQTVDLMVPPVEIGGMVDNFSDLLAGARLVVVNGPSAGVETTTNWIGVWSLTVVPTIDLYVEVRYPGHRTWTFRLMLSVGDISRGHYLKLHPLPGQVPGDPSPSPVPPPTPPAPTPPTPPQPPAPEDRITQNFSGSLEDSYTSSADSCADPYNFSRRVRCHMVTLRASPHQQIAVDLTARNELGSIDPNVELGVQVRQGGTVMANSSNNAGMGTATILFTRINPNQEVEVRVLLLDGRGPAKYTVRTTRNYPY